jgi:hypothetical protein
MPFFGKLLGETLGNIGGAFVGKSDEGRAVGGAIGDLLPFRRGGMVKKTKAKAKKAKKGKGTTAMKTKMAKLRAMKK